MGFFDSRKEKPGLNSLSELEIQEKLYGKFRPPHLTPAPKNQKASAVKPKAPVTSNVSFSDSKESAQKPVGNNGGDFKSFSTPSTPASPTSSRPVTGNLFNFSQTDAFKSEHLVQGSSKHREIPAATSEPRTPIVAKPAVSSSFPADSHLKKFQTFSQEENKVVSNVNASRPASQQQMSPVAEKRVEFQWDWARKIFQIVAEFAIAGILALGRLGKKISNRKVMTWVAAVGFLTFVFWGIHSLNSKREKFMTSPVKKVEKKKEAPAQTPDVPSQALVNTISTPASSISAPKEIASKGNYVIQVATYASLDDANKLVEQFTQQNFRSFIKSFQRNAAGRIYHSVYMGRFAEYSQAETQLEKFRKSKISEPFQDAFIRSLS